MTATAGRATESDLRFLQEQERTEGLKIGDPAPPIKVAQWHKGNPVSIEPGKVYIVEFWATWCQPCIAGMPHLSELAKKYRNDVIVAGINALERGENIQERVADFVAGNSRNMDFNVASDSEDFMRNHWLRAFGESGLPCAFIVDRQGRVAWIGLPANMDSALEKIVSGNWDVEKTSLDREEHKRLSKLDATPVVNSLNPYMGNPGNPQGALEEIDKILTETPGLKYYPNLGHFTFHALLKTDPDKALAFATEWFAASETPKWKSVSDAVIGMMSRKVALPASIYELGVASLQAQLDNYPWSMNFSRTYTEMAEMYHLAGNQVMALRMEQKAKPTTLTGSVKSLADGTTLTLQDLATYGQHSEHFKEAEVKDGKFTFTIFIDEPRYLIIEAGPRNGNMRVVVAPGDNLVLTGENFRSVADSGSVLMTEYREVVGGLQRKHSERVRSLPEEERAAAFQEHLDDVKKAITQYAHTIWAPILIYEYSGSIKQSEAVYETLSDEVKKSLYGRCLRALLDTFLIGKQAPAFTAKDKDGKEYTLTELMNGNKYLLIDFWASWCAPCRKGIPEMKEFAKKYASNGLVLLSISIDSDRAAWLKALDEEQMPWANVHDVDGSIKKVYGVGAIPSVFLIDAEEKIVFEKLYGEAIGEQLNKVFGF